MKRNVMFSIVLFLMVAAVCEAGLRVYQRVARGVPLMSLVPSWNENRFPMSAFLPFGPRVDWQIPGKQAPDFAYFNHQGFRTRDTIGPKGPDEFRIIALGGSTTEGVWNEAGIHWPLVLECALRENGYENVRVLNTAMSAYTTAHSLVRLSLDVVDYEPDLILVMHNINDLSVTYHAAQLGRPVDGHYSVMFGEKRYTGEMDQEDVALSRIAWSIKTRIDDLRRPDPLPLENYDLRPGLRVYQRNLRSINAVAEAHGARAVFLTMPFNLRKTDQLLSALGPRQVGVSMAVEPERLGRDMDAFNQALEDVSREADAPRIDMNTRIGTADSLFADVVHYTTAGELAFGESLAPAIAPLLATTATSPAAASLPCTGVRQRIAAEPS